MDAETKEQQYQASQQKASLTERLKTMEQTGELTTTIIEVMNEQGYHHLQVEELCQHLARLRQEGMDFSSAMEGAVDQTGPPARQRVYNVRGSDGT